jgi:septum formation protein
MAPSVAPRVASGPIILGSASPRRAEVLESLRVPFVVRAAAIDEDVRAGEAPGAYLTRVVSAKLAAVYATLPEDDRARAAAILVADTSVIDGAIILGKPVDVDEAARMIARLSGRTHEVMTRFALGSATDGRELFAQTVTTRVTFRALTLEQSRAYAESGEGLDKAGAYAAQGLGGALVERIEGSYSNVVGLPACEVACALERLGVWTLGAGG